MSGNPFRVSHHQNPSSPASPPSSRSIQAENVEGSEQGIDSVRVSSPPAAKTKKSVRIESPTASPPHPAVHQDGSEAFQHRDRPDRDGTPPPTLPGTFPDDVEDKSFDDVFDKSFDGAGDIDNEEEGMTEPGKSSAVTGHPPASTPSTIPPNPFSKTMATIEPSSRITAEPREYTSSRTAPERAGSGAARQSLDVEGFKRLLMTGTAHPTHSGSPSIQSSATPNFITAPIVESSSTDTSSISRQSIFEPVQEALAESPRTSYEMAASEDDENIALVGESKKTQKWKPPPPKHRHGKLVTARTPQTVSFSDFSSSFVPQPATSPISKRTNSDLNKPLPPPPPMLSPPPHIYSQDSSQDGSGVQRASSNPLPNRSSVSLSEKRTPPPVPLARRQSQLRSSTAGNRSRSNSSLTISSQNSIDLPVSSPRASDEPTSHPRSIKSPPPPPPSRRHGATISTSTPNLSTIDLPSATSSRHLPDSSRHTFSSSPPSPALGPNRTRSVNSPTSARSVSEPHAHSPMAPPPPPPRRRQSGRSGRSSLDKERPGAFSAAASTEEIRRTSLEGNRRTSVTSESSLRYGYTPDDAFAVSSPRGEMTEEPKTMEEAPVESASAEGILDDMARFQQEVDELRKRYSKVE